MFAKICEISVLPVITAFLKYFEVLVLLVQPLAKNLMLISSYRGFLSERENDWQLTLRRFWQSEAEIRSEKLEIITFLYIFLHFERFLHTFAHFTTYLGYCKWISETSFWIKYCKNILKYFFLKFESILDNFAPFSCEKSFIAVV